MSTYTQCEGENADNYQQFDEITENSQIQDFIVEGTLTIPCGITIVDQQVQQLTDKSQITEIILPDTLQTIEFNAFSGLTGLTEIIIPGSVTQIGSGAFQDCNQLSCVAILNSECSIDGTAFQNTQFETSYRDYMGEDKRCFEQGYGYCNTDQYLYVVDINDLYTCTTVDNVDYYYKDEIDEEEVNIRVENCQQINYQYQIQGIPIECVENCNGYTYIQEQYCVNECDEEHEFIQDGQCVAECTGEYVRPIDGNICNATCNYYQVNDTTKQCINDCSEAGVDYDYIYQYENRYECIQTCEQYRYTNNTFTVCTQTLSCENIIVDGQQLQYVDDNQCVDSCQYNKYYNGSNTHCTQNDNCQGIEVDEEQLQYLEGEFCVADCSLEYPVKDDVNKTCSNTCEGDLTFVEDGQCVQQCTEGRFVADMQQTLKTCITNCGQLDPPKYGDTLSDPKQCIENCSTTTYKYSQEFECVEQCTGDYAKPYQQESGQCSTTCAFMNNTSNNKECVSSDEHCPIEGYYLIQQHNSTRDECTDTTQYYITLNNQTKQVIDDCNDTYPYLVQNVTDQPQECVESCELIPDYNIFNEHTAPKQCVNNCTGDYSYIQDNYCESGCTGDYAIPINYPTDNVCDNNCTFYEVDSVKQCTESCQQPYQFSFTDSTTNRTQCVQDCQNTELQYTQNNTCVQGCTGEYAYPIDYETTDKTCSNSCMYYTNNSTKYCTDQCTQQDQEYILNTTGRKYCVGNCQGQDTYNLSYTDDQGVKYCVDECPEDYIDQNGTCELDEPEIECEEGEYVQNNQCVDQCNGEYAKPVSGNICDNQCKYYTNITDNVKYCVDTDCPVEYPYYADLERDQCVSNCNETTLTYSEEYTCVQQCSGEYAEPQDTNNKICDQSCKYYTNDNNKYCMDPCSGSYSFTVDTDGRDYCVSDCSTNNDGYNLTQGEYCVQQCSPGYEQTEEGECVASCQPDEYLQNGECVEQCQESMFIEEENKLCVEQCSSEYQYTQDQLCTNVCDNYIIEGENIDQCVSQCSGEYAQPEDPSNKTCDNQCQYHIKDDGYRYCDSECDGDYSYHYSPAGQVQQCVSNCAEQASLQYTQGNQCVSTCTGEYAIPNDTQKICSNTCIYYQQSSVKYCTEQCPSSQNYLVNSSRQYCVSSCSEQSGYNLQLTENNVNYCVSSCPETYENQNNVCVSINNQMDTNMIIIIVLAVVLVLVIIAFIITTIILCKRKQPEEPYDFVEMRSNNGGNGQFYNPYKQKI